ncbi:hypothetical protein J9978_14925, partial [Chromobacterium violaceum]|uniref:hypothetical protein n=1 Tax=Chromobacterium violaceum TaxID=536 RepID=UPI001B337F63
KVGHRQTPIRQSPAQSSWALRIPAPDTAPAMPKLIAMKNPPVAWRVFYCRVAGKLVAQPVSRASNGTMPLPARLCYLF